MAGGAPQDATKAAKWFHKAAVQGHTASQFNLGVMYKNGRGVPENHAEAAKWLRNAAEQGHADAQLGLGIMYATGEGVPEDDVQAYAWLNIAAAQGIKNAEEAKQLAVQFMTRGEIVRAQGLAREYWEKYVLPFRE